MSHPGPLPRFDIQRQIGSGGTATIYRALDRDTGGAVALKILHGRSVEQAERFAQEATVLAELTHPAIVRYVAHGSTPLGEHYLAMEWLEGETLDVRLARGALTIAESVELARRVADALASTHRRGIVHRDIKPSNLFLPHGSVPDAKLLDFGLARRVVDARRLTHEGAGVIMGTPMYMAPEQARGEAEIGPRADVFALGCVLFECLTGQPRFTGPTVMAVLAKICLDDSLPIGSLCPGLPGDLESVLERMLANEHHLRPRDGSAIEAALGAVADRLRLAGDEPARPIDAITVKTTRDTLTTGEQRVICVVLVTRPAPPPGDTSAAPARSPDGAHNAATLPLPGSAPLDAALDGALRAAREHYGARLVRLLDGSIVLMLAGRGAPTDHAARAARCALHLGAALPYTAMSISMGRAVMFGQLPVGDVIDRGAQLLAGEAAGAISLDEATVELLRSSFEISADGDRHLLKSERWSDPAPRTLLGRTTVCVGRERELALLEGTFDDCVDEPVSRAVLVTAPAGAGKSRLRHELVERLRRGRAGFEVLVGRGDSIAAGSPFGLLAPAIRGAAGIAAGDPPAARRGKLAARLGRHAATPEAARRLTEFLGEMIGVPSDGEPSPALRAARHDPRLMGDQMRSAWLDWLAAECAHQPVLLVLEDAHWGDRPSVQFVDAALRALRERPLMVLALARPEVDDQFPDLWAGRDLQRVTLRALTRKACLLLAQQILGENIDPSVSSWLVERADGNPFYLEELIRSVASGSPASLPETVLGMVQARLDALGDQARRLLRAASVFGQSFSPGGVSALLGGDEERAALPAHLEALVARELILPVGRGAEEYAFRHALLRDAAYAMLTEGDRALGHLLAGEWLEKAEATDAIVLVEHFERGGDPLRAAHFCREAADEALAGNDLPGAIARALRGVALGAAGATLGQLRRVSAQAHFWRGEYALAESAATGALGELPEGSADWFQALGELVSALGQQGRYAEVARRADQARDAATISGDGDRDGAATGAVTGARLACLIRAAGYLLSGGDYEASDAIVNIVGAATAGFKELEPALASKAHAVRATRCLHSGDQAAAIGLQEAALAAAAAAGDARTMCEMRANLASVWADIGQIERAETLLRDSLSEAQRMEIHYVTAVALINLGPVLAYSGQLVEARRVATQALDFARRQGDQRYEGAAQLYLSTITFLAGEPRISEQRARDAREIVPAPLRPSAEAAIARAVLAQGRADEALRHARAAADLLASAGHVEEYESLVRLMLAEALEACGDPAAARDALRAASARLAERAARIGNPDWRASFLTRLSDNARTLALARTWDLDAEAAPAARESAPDGRRESKI